MGLTFKLVVAIKGHKTGVLIAASADMQTPVSQAA